MAGLDPTSVAIVRVTLEGLTDQLGAAGLGSIDDDDQIERMAGARSVARCESGLRPRVVADNEIQGCSGGGSKHPTGLFQIVPSCHPTWADKGDLRDPLLNTRAAYAISRGWSDWGQWECDPAPTLDDRKRILEVVAEFKRGNALTRLWDDVVATGTDWGTAVADVVDTVTDPLSQIRDFLAFVADGKNWTRVLLVVGGAAVATAGVVFIVRDLSAPIVSAAAEAAS